MDNVYEVVQITEEQSATIERCYLEYNGALNTVGYLMSRPDVREDLLQKYLDITEMKYVELELNTQAAIRSYPSKNDFKYYKFDFYEFKIIYMKYRED